MDKSIQNEGGEIEMSDRIQRKRSDDFQHEGGASSKSSKKNKAGGQHNEVGFFQGIMNSLKGNNNSQSENDGSKIDWNKMTPTERDERKR